ncbi:testis-expressed sequence 26 protein-like [Arapaima gigas]
MALKHCGGACNSPHPQATSAQGFHHNSEDAMSPWKRPSSDQHIRNAVSSEYLSTYRADYLGIQRGFQMKCETSAPRKKRAVPQCFVTEMRHSYQHPKNLAKMKNNTSRYGCNTLHGVVAKGIVPNVVFGQMRYQETKKPLPTYSRHIGVKTVDNQGMLISLQPSKQQQFCGQILRKGKVELRLSLLLFTCTVLFGCYVSRSWILTGGSSSLDKKLFQTAPSSPAKRMEYLTAVRPQATEPVPAWISEWPGPL